MLRELIEEMIAFACRGFTHPRGQGKIEQLDNFPERRVVKAEDHNLEDRKDCSLMSRQGGNIRL